VLQTLILTLALVGAAGFLASITGSRWPLALLMTALLGRGVLSLDWRREILAPYAAIRLHHLAVGLVALALPIGVYVLTAGIPVLNWSILGLFGQEGGNVAAAGLQVGWLFALPYLLLLLASLPTLALVEEYWFRRGTRGWRDGLVRSLLFGLAHTLVGVPLGVAVFGLGAVGLLFTAFYLRAARGALRPAAAFTLTRFPAASPAQAAGMQASALQHLAYNALAVLIGAGATLAVELIGG
jgi:hypothetical protein